MTLTLACLLWITGRAITTLGNHVARHAVTRAQRGYGGRAWTGK